MSTQNGNGGPLSGIRMLDLGRYQAGPRCALMFARMGAEVIKVEALKGDESRQNGPTVRGQSAYWVQYNSGKKRLAIDLRTDKGKEVLTRLVKKSDIFLQNFRPGTIDIMGFGYDVLKKCSLHRVTTYLRPKTWLAMTPRITGVNHSCVRTCT